MLQPGQCPVRGSHPVVHLLRSLRTHRRVLSALEDQDWLVDSWQQPPNLSLEQVELACCPQRYRVVAPNTTDRLRLNQIFVPDVTKWAVLEQIPEPQRKGQQPVIEPERGGHRNHARNLLVLHSQPQRQDPT